MKITYEKYKNFLKELLKREKKIKFFLSRVLVKTGLNYFVKINRESYQIWFSKNNIASEMFINGKSFYLQEENFINSFLDDKSVFVDVGANIGNLTLSASNVIKKGKIFSFEANPQTFRSLKRNIQLNKKEQITAINSAIGSKKGFLRISHLYADDCNSIQLEGNGVEVPVQTLDHYLYNQPNIDFLKIDIEGYELFALMGANKTLNKTKIIYLEVWDKLTKKYQYSGIELLTFLKNAGFQIFLVNNKFELTKLRNRKKFNTLEMILAVKK